MHRPSLTASASLSQVSKSPTRGLGELDAGRLGLAALVGGVDELVEPVLGIVAAPGDGAIVAAAALEHQLDLAHELGALVYRRGGLRAAGARPPCASPRCGASPPGRRSGARLSASPRPRPAPCGAPPRWRQGGASPRLRPRSCCASRRSGAVLPPGRRRGASPRCRSRTCGAPHPKRRCVAPPCAWPRLRSPSCGGPRPPPCA